MNLNLPMRQVIVKQCRAVNARLNDLKTLINKSQRPRKEALLFELYKVRGDEDAFYDEDDPEPEPSSDEDEDDNATHSRGRSPTPRRLALPTSRRARRGSMFGALNDVLSPGHLIDRRHKFSAQYEVTRRGDKRVQYVTLGTISKEDVTKEEQKAILNHGELLLCLFFSRLYRKQRWYVTSLETPSEHQL